MKYGIQHLNPHYDDDWAREIRGGPYTRFLTPDLNAAYTYAALLNQQRPLTLGEYIVLEHP